MTTELSPSALYENREWKSFMRPGRVDFFIEYVRGDGENNHVCKKVTHVEIPNYQ
jgi:hypothetical protein